MGVCVWLLYVQMVTHVQQLWIILALVQSWEHLTSRSYPLIHCNLKLHQLVRCHVCSIHFYWRCLLSQTPVIPELLFTTVTYKKKMKSSKKENIQKHRQTSTPLNTNTVSDIARTVFTYHEVVWKPNFKLAMAVIRCWPETMPPKHDGLATMWYQQNHAN